jgi:transcriptional regulator
MADDKGNKPVTREFLSERDTRIFKMRQAGTSIQEIARRFGVSSGVVSNAIKRQLEKLNNVEQLEAVKGYYKTFKVYLTNKHNDRVSFNIDFSTLSLLTIFVGGNLLVD